MYKSIENETIADILGEMRQDIADGTVGIWSDFGGEVARCYVSRIDAAYGREVGLLSSPFTPSL